MKTTNNQVVYRQTEVEDIAHISTLIEGQYVEATVSVPRSGEYSQEEILSELQDRVWWVKLQA